MAQEVQHLGDASQHRLGLAHVLDNSTSDLTVKQRKTRTSWGMIGSSTMKWRYRSRNGANLVCRWFSTASSSAISDVRDAFLQSTSKFLHRNKPCRSSYSARLLALTPPGLCSPLGPPSAALVEGVLSSGVEDADLSAGGVSAALCEPLFASMVTSAAIGLKSTCHSSPTTKKFITWSPTRRRTACSERPTAPSLRLWSRCCREEL